MFYIWNHVYDTNPDLVINININLCRHTHYFHKHTEQHSWFRPSEIFCSLESIWASFCCRSANSPRPEKSTRNSAMMESIIWWQVGTEKENEELEDRNVTHICYKNWFDQISFPESDQKAVHTRYIVNISLISVNAHICIVISWCGSPYNRRGE